MLRYGTEVSLFAVAADIMSPRDIALAVLVRPPTTPERFAKLARLVKTRAQLDALKALLPSEVAQSIEAGMRGRVTN